MINQIHNVVFVYFKGVATLVGIAMVAIILPLNLYIARRQHGLQRFILKMKGKRVRLINEILSGIKVLSE